MIRTFSKLLLFGIIGVVVIYIITSHYDYRFRKKLEKTSIPAKILKKSKFNYLIMGDSHAAKLRVQVFPENTVFGFQEGSDNIKNMYCKLVYTLKHHQFDTLIMQVDRHLFSGHRKGNNNVLNSIYLSDYPLAHEVYKFNPLEYGLHKVLFYFPALFPGNAVIFRKFLYQDIKDINLDTRHIKKRFLVDWDDYWIKLSQEERNQHAREKIDVHFKTTYVSDLAAYFGKIYRLCKENNITIIGIRYPLTREYLEYLKKYPLDEVEQEYAKYSLPKILDYTYEYMDQPHLFKNSNHLNWKGSLLFSEKVALDLGLTPHPEPDKIKKGTWFLTL